MMVVNLHQFKSKYNWISALIAVCALTFGGEEGGEVVGHRPLGSRMHVAFAEQVSNSTPHQHRATQEPKCNDIRYTAAEHEDVQECM